MQMSYVSPSGQKVLASDDAKSIPIVNISGQTIKINPQTTSNNSSASASAINSQDKKNYDLSKADDFRQFIEVETLKIIKKLAEEGKTEKERIQAIAQRTLDLIKPGMTLEELYQNAVKLDDNFSELAPLVYVIMRHYEEKYEKKALECVSQLVKKKEFDEAVKMVQKVLQFKLLDKQ